MAKQASSTSRRQKKGADVQIPVADAGERPARCLSSLARFAVLKASDLSLEELLAQVTDAALECLRWDAALLYVRDAAGRLVQSVVRGFASPPLLLSAGETLMQRSLEAGVPLLLDPLSDEDGEALGIKGAGFVRAILAPMIPASAVLVVATRGNSPLHPDDLPFLQTLAALTGERVANHALRGSRDRMRTGLEAVHRVSRTASETAEVGKALESALEAARRALQASSCAVYEAMEPGQQLRCVANLNTPEALIQAVEIYSARTPAKRILKTDLPEIVNALGDYTGDARVAEIASGVGIQAALILPIYVGGHDYGLLSVYDSQPRKWSESELRMGQILASIIGGALSRARSLEKITQSAARLQRLHQVSARLIVSGGPERSAMVATESGRDLLRADAAAIQVYDEKYRLLKLVSAHPPEMEYLPTMTTIGRGISGKAVSEMKTVVRPLHLARADFDGFAAAVPLRSQDELIGVLVVFRSVAKGAFDRDDLEFLELFASIVATSMQNARLLGRSEELGILTERNRIATEMHDSVGDNLAALLMKAELAQVALNSDPQRTRAELERIISTLRASIVEMRRILRALKPVDLQKMGLVDAIRKIAEDYTHNCGIPVLLQVSDGIPSLGQKAEYVLYRAVNESLNNARKHSGASSIKVSFQADSSEFVLTVEDNGRGFSPTEAGQKHGLGLSGLRDSVEAAGGRFELVSAPQNGTRVSVRFPVHGVT